jgi:flotillin
MQVQVANQTAQSATGQKEAERSRRIEVARLEAEGVSGEVTAQRDQEVAIATQQALTVQGKKQAEMEQRVRVSDLESDAVKGENEAQAKIAAYQASLAEARAEAKRRGDVAMANAARDVLMAEKEQELAKLEKEQLAQQMIERKKIEVDAEAEAERIRRIAKGEADGVLARYMAEAAGVRKVLEAKAAGYESLMRACGPRVDLAPALLIIEKLPDLVAEQVKAIQNLKIDKITVWDSGAGNKENGAVGSTSQFLRGLISSLPPIHELAQQAGIDLPEVLGRVQREAVGKSGDGKATDHVAGAEGQVRAGKPPAEA